MPIWVEQLGCWNNSLETSPPDFKDIRYLLSGDGLDSLAGRLLLQFKNDPGRRK